MSHFLSSLDWRAVASAALEIALLFLVIYGILRFLEGTRGAGLLRGLVFLVIMALLVAVFVIEKLRLYRLEYLVTRDALLFFLFITVLFQAEIRRLLLRLGQTPMIRMLFHTEHSLVPEIVNAAFALSERRIGALMVLERDVGLGVIIEAGTPIDATVSNELLVTIFWPGTPLHDGAVIIRGNRVAAGGCLLPLTEQPGLAKTLGTRHRAAIGITEESDAISIVVSEETRQVSLARNGQLRMGLSREDLRHILEETVIETAAVHATGGGS